MTTINNYSVSLGLNASGLIDGSKLARNEVASLRRTFDSLTTPTERVERKIDLIEKALRQEAISADTARVAMDRLNSSVKHGTSMAGSLQSKVAGLAAGYVSVSAAANIVRESITKAAATEKATASFAVLTGSMERSREVMDGVRVLAARGLSLDALSQSARTMLSFNVAAKDVIPSLERIGNITGGDTERLKMLSLAFSQSSAAGRLMGQDLLQMINAGFNPLQEISRKTGKSLVDLKKDMEDGLISFSMVNEAFRTATESGGLYNGMLSKMGETTAGAMDRANAKVEMLKISLGEALSPAVRSLATAFEESSENIATTVKELGRFIATMTEVADRFNSPAWKKIFEVADRTSHFGAIQRAGRAVTDNLDLYSRNQQKREEAILRTRERFGKTFFDMFSNYGGEGARLERLNAELERTNKILSDRVKAAKSLENPMAALPDLAGRAPDPMDALFDGKKRELDILTKMEHDARERERRADLANARRIWQERERKAAEAEKKIRDVRISSPQAIQVGSAEAYKFFADRDNKKAEQQLKIAMAQKALEEEANRLLTTINAGITALKDNIKRKR